MGTFWAIAYRHMLFFVYSVKFLEQKSLYSFVRTDAQTSVSGNQKHFIWPYFHKFKAWYFSCDSKKGTQNGDL